MKVRLSILLLFGFVTAGGVLADEITRRVQEELRKRNLYFGEIDGQMNAEMSNAVKKYQSRKGFGSTGEIDRETANALNVPNLGAELPSNPGWPDVPILKSDVARDLPEPERAALEERAAQDPDPSPNPAPPAESPPPNNDPSAERLTKLVEDYLRDAETDDVDLQVGYYAFPVDYFDHGRVNRDFVTKDTRNYVKRWPARKYTLRGPVKSFADAKKDEIRIEFTIDFDVRNQKHAVRGKTRNFWTIKAENLRIVALKEQRVHE